jgi:hypothetical protein
MMDSFLKRAIAVAVLAGASVGAHATTTNLGTISNSGPTGLAGTVLGGGQSFSDIFSFNFSGPNTGSHFQVMDIPTTVSEAVTFNGILTAISLFSAGANGVVGGGDDSLLASSISPGGSSLTLNYDHPLSGTDYITVTGVANGSSGAIFAGQIAPVPEAETYAMLLAGLGLMGAVIRRRSMNKNS